MVKCTVIKFQFIKIKQEDVDWKHDWSSAFYLAAETSLLRREEEYLVFDMSDTVNGIGGAMGLFRGLSVLDLAFQIIVMIRFALNLLDKKQKVTKKKQLNKC